MTGRDFPRQLRWPKTTALIVDFNDRRIEIIFGQDANVDLLGLPSAFVDTLRSLQGQYESSSRRVGRGNNGVSSGRTLVRRRRRSADGGRPPQSPGSQHV